MKRLVILMFVLCAVSCLFGYFWPRPAENQIIVEPLTAKFVTTTNEPSGVLVLDSLVVAVNTKGDRVYIDSDGGVTTTITVRTSEKQVLAVQGTSMKSTFYFDKPDNRDLLLLRPPNVGADCRFLTPSPDTTITSLGEDTYLGFKIFKYKQSSSGGESEGWFAADKNCLPVYQKFTPANSDGKAPCPVVERRLISITFGEPNPLLFAIDDKLQEVPPSAMSAEHRQRTGLPIIWTKGIERVDQAYDLSRVAVK